MNAKTYQAIMNRNGWKESETVRYYINRAKQWQKQIMEAKKMNDLEDVPAMLEAKDDEIKQALMIAEFEHELGVTIDDPLVYDKVYEKYKRETQSCSDKVASHF